MSRLIVESVNRSAGRLDDVGNEFIDIRGVQWGFIDRIFDRKAYLRAKDDLLQWSLDQRRDQYHANKVSDECEAKYASDTLLEIDLYPTYYHPRPKPDPQVMSLNIKMPTDEELEMMSGRNQPTIKHIGEPRFTMKDICDNGGLIPIKSNVAFQIKPRQAYHIMSGFIIDIPLGYMGVLYPRKGMNQRGIELKGQLIHAQHDKEFTIYLKNTDLNEYADVGIGEEVAQLAIVPIRTDFKII